MHIRNDDDDLSMTDLPIRTRSTETFTDTPPSHQSSNSPPLLVPLSNVDLDGFFNSSEPHDVAKMESLTALSLLNYLITRLMQTEIPGEPMSLNSSEASETGGSNNGVDEDDGDCDDDSPLSPKKRRWSNVNQCLEMGKTNNDADSNTEQDNNQRSGKSTSPSRDLQTKHLIKRFRLNNDPDLSVSDYLNRINKYCQLSTSVYLGSAYYIHMLVVKWEIFQLTNLNAHRLIIAALRLACKTLEDITHRQQFFAQMGGIRPKDLQSLEISFLFLIKFNCQVDVQTLEETVKNIKVLYDSSKNAATN
ncbi:Cyclin-U2-2 [Cyberlindnera fabianii]|uniref:Cyclin-U2-2 n=1 Tax=Cyberlindnera fabianii TaxID=36022 RepID=A0A1V2L7N6_CYBFA|nr:Cyclin-U2-2 [Cyberlindnera fabianii]